MSEELIEEKSKNIIAIGRLLWEKELVTGLNGNISVRLDEGMLLITAHGACLGLLQEKDILQINLEGNVIGEGAVSTEKLLHIEIYKNLKQSTAIIHTHTTYTNAYFLENETLEPRIFESKLYLGSVQSVEQLTPAVTDVAPVIDVLKNNNIAVLRNHGVVAMGKDLFDCFLLIQALEDAVKVDAISKLYAGDRSPVTGNQVPEQNNSNGKYKLFSRAQIEKIVELVNADEQMAELGTKTNMTFDLAIKLNETEQVYKLSFDQGRVKDIGEDAEAEFVVSAPEDVWRAVFNREIDPFVATTQKKMQLDGDFAKISKWYAPCSRVFEIWTQVPVE